MPRRSVPTEGDKLLTLGQVGERLAVSRWTVRRMVAAGLLPVVPVGAAEATCRGRPRTRGRAVRVRASAVERYIREFEGTRAGQA